MEDHASNDFAADVADGLRTRTFGRPLHVLDRTDSTNTYAVGLARRGAPEGTVVIADAQSHGKGRLGRRWVSPPGVNLYLSVVLRPPVPAGVAPQLSLLAAVAVADTIRLVCRLAPEIKWPNDVLLDSRKVCGILAEMQTKGGALQSVVLGIGVNVNAAMSAFPESLRDKATSLLLAGGREVDRGAFTVKLLTHLEKWYVLWVQEGLAGIRPAWEAHAAGFLGKHVVVNTAKGRVSGLARGLSLDGALVVQRSDTDEVYHLVAGDVTIVEGYRRGQSGRSHDAGD